MRGVCSDGCRVWGGCCDGRRVIWSVGRGSFSSLKNVVKMLSSVCVCERGERERERDYECVNMCTRESVPVRLQCVSTSTKMQREREDDILQPHGAES